MAAYHFSIRAHDENGTLLRQSRGAPGFGEVPSSVLTRYVGYCTAIVHLSAYQDNSRLLPGCLVPGCLGAKYATPNLHPFPR